MKRKIVLANLILAAHGFIVAVILFGWAVRPMRPLYIATLLLTGASYLVFGNCLLSKWEFDLRKQVNPSISYDATWLGYYAPGILRKLPNAFWYWVSTAFVVISIGANAFLMLK